MKVSIIGTGYVGIVTGACLADQGHRVVCVDIDPKKVDMINGGTAPIHEPGLPELMARHVGKGLSATADLKRAVEECEMTLIAVGTPAAGGKIDLTFVERAASEIGTALKTKSAYHTVIVKSTVIPGTTEGVVRRAVETASGKKSGVGFGLGMNPEFLTEGTAVEDFARPDRLVLGGIDARTHEMLSALYAGFDPAVPRILTNPSTAEMIKYASNAVLATMISFSNEIARLCAAVGGVDALDVMRGVHQATYFTTRVDGKRITAGIASFLEAGCGFGGSCLPKDVTALTGQGQAYDLPMPLLRGVLEINRTQPDEMMKLIAKHRTSLKDARVAVLGIAFKPDTDDVRESPAFPILRKLKSAGARVTAYDPIARPENHEGLVGIDLADTLEDAVRGAEIVVLVTRWAEFKGLAQILRAQKSAPLVIDGRRLLSPGDFAQYEGIGRSA
jgi:UDPglucose 6-dehydrogenase/GDP-mannose 6-dehydrogenase